MVHFILLFMSKWISIKSLLWSFCQKITCFGAWRLRQCIHHNILWIVVVVLGNTCKAIAHICRTGIQRFVSLPINQRPVNVILVFQYFLYPMIVFHYRNPPGSLDLIHKAPSSAYQYRSSILLKHIWYDIYDRLQIICSDSVWYWSM